MKDREAIGAQSSVKLDDGESYLTSTDRFRVAYNESLGLATVQRLCLRTSDDIDRQVKGMWKVEDDGTLCVADSDGKLTSAAEIFVDGILVVIDP